ncbi:MULTISPECIES: putative translational regulatory protein ArgL [Citrobacter]
MNKHPYKLNFNSINGLGHVRKPCLRFIRSTF